MHGPAQNPADPIPGCPQKGTRQIAETTQRDIGQIEMIQQPREPLGGRSDSATDV